MVPGSARSESSSVPTRCRQQPGKLFELDCPDNLDARTGDSLSPGPVPSMKVAPPCAPAALWVGFLLMAGCAGVDRSPKVDAAPVGSASTARPVESSLAPTAPPAASAPAPPATRERVIAPPAPAVASAAQADAASSRHQASTPAASTPKASAKLASAPQTATQSPKVPAAPATASAPAAKAEAPSSLDLKSLETRLKETKAIGVFTKLALKNQIDELLDRFRSYYQGQLEDLAG